MSGPLSLDTLRAIVAEAARAPSAHNVQAARWATQASEARIVLLRDPSRNLPVADPTGRDDRAGLGAALEGFALAAGMRGLQVADLSWAADAHRTCDAATIRGLDVVATFELRAGGTEDPLAPYVVQRRTWRGALRNDAAASAALLRLRDDPDARDARILGHDVAPEVALLVDEATWAFERQPAHHAELWRWLRLNPREPAYHRDGLTADAMLLSNAERAAARVLMRPGVFRILQRTGLGRALVAESGATRTAAGFICFCPAANASDYEVGRGLYRLWLAATRAGLVLAPMSAIADHPQSRTVIEARLALGGGRRLVQIFRAGTIDRQPPRSPRLPVEELLLVP
ncbi:MAG TPA: hypothetical protein VFT96_11520 [Gemmatimonadaceae bacterium]|nr:hypothetical protein [Gemmatimonadaceae bacterium]